MGNVFDEILGFLIWVVIFNYEVDCLEVWIK